ncbi:hypothetical protein CLU79DRAFT_755022 [Phycomyces nitens]|nr:hypothetical protein CLU79DRAFT_755022 [Phycomyces nitens]
MSDFKPKTKRKGNQKNCAIPSFFIMPVVYIIFYSLYGHIYTLSESVKQGLESQGITVKVFQVSPILFRVQNITTHSNRFPRHCLRTFSRRCMLPQSQMSR